MAFAADKTRQATAGTAEDYYEYKIDQSLRFNTASSAKLTRTPSSASSATDRRKFTLSFWFKPDIQVSGNNPDANYFWGAGEGSGQVNLKQGLEGDGTMWFQFERSGANLYISSTQKFRDHSAWYHCVFQWDTTLATASDRVKIYINNERITDWTHWWSSTTDYSAIAQNGSYFWNDADFQFIGCRPSDNSDGNVGNLHYGGYMAEFHNIDGSIVAPTSFGEAGDYGDWVPIEYDTADGAYGTNGFYLNFAGGGIIAATGGTITTDGSYKVHSFTADGTFTPTSVSGGGFVEYLVIAGGGGGGHSDGSNLRGAGGGGAGGYRTGYLAVTEQGYSITVGDGGAGASGAYGNTSEIGDNSVFSSITSTGGGGGTGHTSSADTSTGGSGGGGSWAASRRDGGSASPSGQGNDGGDGGDSHPNHGGGGGGGASAAGANRSSGTGGVGGAGLASSITGASVTRAGGGGGGGSSTGGAGGSGGGGAGQSGTSNSSTAGTANTGGGGGGAADGADAGGDGGSGIVIIRYKFQ